MSVPTPAPTPLSGSEGPVETRKPPQNLTAYIEATYSDGGGDRDT
jgi:hypothetical protein